jgi:hypothetical protein
MFDYSGSGREYYYNTRTDDSSWTKPKSLRWRQLPLIADLD